LRGRDIDDADAAARLDAVFVELGALAIPAFGDGEQRPPRLHDLHRDDDVVVSQRDAADAVRGPAHGSNIALFEADGHTVFGADEDFASAVGDAHGNDRIAFFDAHRDD